MATLPRPPPPPPSKSAVLLLEEWGNLPNLWPHTLPTKPHPVQVFPLTTRNLEPWHTWWMQLEAVLLDMVQSTMVLRTVPRCLETMSRRTPSRLSTTSMVERLELCLETHVQLLEMPQ